MMLIKTTKEEIDVNGLKYTLKVYHERRSNCRASVVKTGINIRVPFFLTPWQKKKRRRSLREWGLAQLEKRHLHQVKTYENGSPLKVGQKDYIISINREERKTCSARLIQNNIIDIRLPHSMNFEEAQQQMKPLLSRCVAKDQHAMIAEKLHRFNEQYYQKTIRQIRLRYNHSNWGSCSRNGNISISTRVLFAPEEVIDYVCIHELAHLVEPNHSKRFWYQVARAMPHYQEMEKWLRHHGPTCHF